jgi:hypothetical protein
MLRRLIVRTTVTAVFGAAWLASAGCGGSSPGTDAQPTTTPASSPAPQTPAEAAQQAAQSLQQLAQNQTAPAVDFEKLVALIPEQSGWTRSEPKGQQVSMGVSISRAEAEYTKDDSTITLEITDSAFSQMLMAPLSMMLMTSYSERTSDGYKKYAAVGGSPGFETWASGSKEGEVTAVVANRFIVHARGTNVPGIDPVRAVVQAVDFGKLTALK